MLPYIHGSVEILKDLDNHIKDGNPFSIVRLGDVGHGTVAYYRCRKVISHVSKWSSGGIPKTVFSKLGVPPSKISGIVNLIVQSANEANYIDSQAAFCYELKENGVPDNTGRLADSWKKIHEAAGITNTSYCNSRMHYFAVVEGRYNLLDVLKDRAVFCISNQLQTLPKLKELSGAKSMDSYWISRRGGGRHYRDHYKDIMNIIKNDAKKYDLFLIGAGLLARVYCGEVKRHGGRVFDAGRLFDFWSGRRIIKGRAKHFVRMNRDKLLCERIKGSNNRIW